MAANPSVLRAIERVAAKRKVSRKELLAAVETGVVESGLRNLPGGDADSAGWRQERASLYKNPTNLEASINRFFDETGRVRDKYGTAGQLAAAVQRPAAQYRGRYEQVRGKALGLLGNGGAMQAAPASVASASAPSDVGATSTDSAAFDDARKKYALGRMIAQNHPQSSLLRLGILPTVAPSAADFTSTTPADPTAPLRAGTRHESLAARPAGQTGRVKITGPNPGRVKPVVRDFMSQISGVRGGRTITGSDGTGHSRLTTSGNVSQHTTGNASDIPATGSELRNLGQAALIAAGMPRAQARKQQGGLYNLQWHGRRVQVIFNTHIGGDHTDHLHVGVA